MCKITLRRTFASGRRRLHIGDEFVTARNIRRERRAPRFSFRADISDFLSGRRRLPLHGHDAVIGDTRFRRS